MPHVSSLLSSSPNDMTFLHTLELFAYGTYNDYLNQSEKYLNLTPNQLLKLKQLTVVSTIQSHSTPYVPYTILYTNLHISSIRELEDLLMECIYSNIITGKCDQRSMCFISTHTISRDVKLSQVSTYINTLEEWRNKTRVLLDVLSKTGSNASQNRMMEEEFWRGVDAEKGSRKDLGMKSPSGMDIGIEKLGALKAIVDESENRKASKRSRAFC